MIKFSLYEFLYDDDDDGHFAKINENELCIYIFK
jgi:hypothetical protein